MRTWILRAVVIAFATPIAGLLTWYGVSFLPHVSQMKELAKAGSNDVQPAFDSLYEYAVAAETKSGIRAYAVRQSYRYFVWNNKRQRMLAWPANTALWYFASFVHFTDKEMFGLWLSCSLEGCGKGLPVAAVTYYGKSIETMSERELVGLVALVKSPSAFKPGTLRSEQRIQFILNKVKAHNTLLQPTSGLRCSLPRLS